MNRDERIVVNLLEFHAQQFISKNNATLLSAKAQIANLRDGAAIAAASDDIETQKHIAAEIERQLGYVLKDLETQLQVNKTANSERDAIFNTFGE